jgi:hypothetical protein
MRKKRGRVTSNVAFYMRTLKKYLNDFIRFYEAFLFNTLSKIFKFA